MEGDVISVLALLAVQAAEARDVLVGPGGEAPTLEEAWRSGRLWPEDLAILTPGYDANSENQPLELPMPLKLAVQDDADVVLPSLLVPKGITATVTGGVLTGQQRLLVEHGGVLEVTHLTVRDHEGIALGGGGYLEVEGGTFSGNFGPVIAMERGVANINNATFSDNVGLDWRPGDIDTIGKGEWTLVRGTTFAGSSNPDPVSANEDTALGGAIRAGGTHLVVQGSSFEGTTADYGAGGAIAVLRIPGEATRPLFHIEDALFSSTSAGLSGGAIAAVDTGGRIVDSTFIGNSVTDAESIGGAIAATWTTLEVDGSSFKNQTAGISSTSMAVVNSSVRISGSDFASTQEGLAAGGILTSAPAEDLPAETNLRVFNSSFVGGNATLGGAILHAGGRVDLFGNTFSQSSGGVGGAAALIETWGRVHHNTFEANGAIYGGALAIGDAELQVQDNTFRDAVAVEGGAVLWTESNWATTPYVARNRFCGVASIGYVNDSGERVRAAAADLRTTWGFVSNNLVYNVEGSGFSFGAEPGSDYADFIHNTVVGVDAALLAGGDYTWWDNIVSVAPYGVVTTSRYFFSALAIGGFNVFHDVPYPAPILGGYTIVPSDTLLSPQLTDASDCAGSFAPGPSGSAYQNASDRGNRGWDGGPDKAGRDQDGDGVPVELDCDDQSAFGYLRFPGNPEVCDGYDNDCDGLIDEDATDTRVFYPDVDGDGLGDKRYPLEGIQRCRIEGFVTNNSDCDDQDANIPGPEVPNNYVDEDCDDKAQWSCWWDQDQDGVPVLWTVPLPSPDLCVEWSEDQPQDCDDFDLNVYPGAVDIPLNGVDENCDGTDEIARLRGGSCSTSAPLLPGWLALLPLLGLARRRR